MGKLDELQKMIAEDFQKASDAEVVKRLAAMKQLTEEAEKENSELLKAHQQLKDEYVKSVKSQVVSDKPSQAPKKRDMKQIVQELGLADKFNKL